MRMDRQIAVTDQVQFLVLAELKPSPRKIERRSVQGRKFQGVAIKRDACFDIGNMQGNVIELSNNHGHRGKNNHEMLFVARDCAKSWSEQLVRVQ